MHTLATFPFENLAINILFYIQLMQFKQQCETFFAKIRAYVHVHEKNCRDKFCMISSINAFFHKRNYSKVSGIYFAGKSNAARALPKQMTLTVELSNPI